MINRWLSLGIVYLVFSASICFPGKSFAEQQRILEVLPLQVDSIEEAALMPVDYNSAQQVAEVLSKTKHILVHMETLRQANQQLPAPERAKLVDILLKHHKDSPEDATRFFDLGYAKVLFNRNQTGLYYLRKANDGLKNQFATLAYAMAQVDVDRFSENASETELTTRKMDVTYKLTDAVILDAKHHREGFWENYIHVLGFIRQIPAFKGYAKRDYSHKYVPHGKKAKAVEGTFDSYQTSRIDINDEETEEATEEGAEELSCDPADAPDISGIQLGRLERSLPLDIDDDGANEMINFFTGNGETFQVLVYDDDQELILAQFESKVGPYIAEDIDGDKVSELVIRQYREDPLHPVVVYRLEGCQYIRDEKVDAFFK